MDDNFPTNPASKKLGLWISVSAIVFALLICMQSGDSNPISPAAEIQEIPRSLAFNSRPAPAPVIIAPFELDSIDELECKEVDSPNDLKLEITDTFRTQPVSLPPPASETKVQAYNQPPKKITPVRGKKAERLFRPIIFRAAQRHQVDPDLVQAIIMAESSFNPNAVSNRGAAGLMQLMPATAKALGVKDVFNPEHNINGGVLYFKKMLKEFRGNVRLALAAYNAGSRKVKEYQDVPPFRTTQAYVNKVFEYYWHYKELLAADDDTALIPHPVLVF